MQKLTSTCAMSALALAVTASCSYAEDFDSVVTAAPLLIDAIVVSATDLSATWVPESAGGFELDALKREGTKLGSIKIATTIPHDVIAVATNSYLLNERSRQVLPFDVFVRGRTNIAYEEHGKDLPSTSNGSTGWLVFESSEPKESIDFLTSTRLPSLDSGEYSALVDVLVANK